MVLIFIDGCHKLFIFPIIFRDITSRPKISSEKWIEYARTAFSVDPRIALSLASKFPTNPFLKSEVTHLVQVCLIYLKSAYSLIQENHFINCEGF